MRYFFLFVVLFLTNIIFCICGNKCHYHRIEQTSYEKLLYPVQPFSTCMVQCNPVVNEAKIIRHSVPKTLLKLCSWGQMIKIQALQTLISAGRQKSMHSHNLVPTHQIAHGRHPRSLQTCPCPFQCHTRNQIVAGKDCTRIIWQRKQLRLLRGCHVNARFKQNIYI